MHMYPYVKAGHESQFPNPNPNPCSRPNRKTGLVNILNKSWSELKKRNRFRQLNEVGGKIKVLTS